MSLAGQNIDRALLLVEDNPRDADLILRSLKKNHLLNPVVTVHDGEEALDYVFARGAYAGRQALPQVVFLDLKLPKLDGQEVLRAIRADERTKYLPVVILTSSDDELDLVRSLVGGANSYVRKPVVFAEFSEAVRQLGLYWLILNEAPQSA
jgi:two-component system response regulator